MLSIALCTDAGIDCCVARDTVEGSTIIRNGYKEAH